MKGSEHEAQLALTDQGSSGLVWEIHTHAQTNVRPTRTHVCKPLKIGTLGPHAGQNAGQASRKQEAGDERRVVTVNSNNGDLLILFTLSGPLRELKTLHCSGPF